MALPRYLNRWRENRSRSLSKSHSSLQKVVRIALNRLRSIDPKSVISIQGQVKCLPVNRPENHFGACVGYVCVPSALRLPGPEQLLRCCIQTLSHLLGNVYP